MRSDCGLAAVKGPRRRSRARRARPCVAQRALWLRSRCALRTLAGVGFARGPPPSGVGPSAEQRRGPRGRSADKVRSRFSRSLHVSGRRLGSPSLRRAGSSRVSAPRGPPHRSQGGYRPPGLQRCRSRFGPVERGSPRERPRFSRDKLVSASRTRCDTCGRRMPPPRGRGRPRKRCELCAADKSALGRAWRAANPDAVAEYNDGRRQQLRARTCRECRDRFTPTRRDSWYCSETCRRRAYRARTGA